MRDLVVGLLALLMMVSFAAFSAQAERSGQAEILSGAARAAYAGAQPSGPMRGTYYWGRASPTNFWNSLRISEIDDDFARLRADGFDTILLVVPWGEFQTQVKPCCKDNDFAWKTLDLLSQKSQAAGLKLIVRIGYPWSMEPDQQWMNLERVERIILDDEVLAAFANFVAKVGAVVGRRNNFKFAFFSWEDFYLHHVMDHGTDRFRGTALERDYRRFLEKYYSLEQLRMIFRDRSLNEFSAVPYPVYQAAYPDDARVRLFNSFWDELLIERLFVTLKQALPAMSMEVRIDAEPIPLKAGGYAWVHHKRTYDLPQAPFLTAYYRIPWGMPNNGDLASPQAAVEKFEYLLAGLSEHFPSKKIFFDQLLFLDNTPGYESNTRLDPAKINLFLESMAVPLGRTGGYALWHVRDYLSNNVYNAGFQRGLTGWQTAGAVALSDAGLSHNVVINPGGVLSQVMTLNRYLTVVNKRWTLCLDVRSVSGDFEGMVRTGEVQAKLDPKRSGRSCMAVDFKPGSKVSISAKRGRIELESVYLYSHEQVQKVYYADGREGPYATGVRSLNRGLAASTRSFRPIRWQRSSIMPASRVRSF